MSDFIRDLESLTPEELQAVKEIISDFAEKNRGNTENSGKKRRKRRKKVEKPRKSRIVKGEAGVKPQRRSKAKTKQRRGEDNRKPPVTTAFEVKERPNLFLKSSDVNKHKKDTAIDKKLRGDNELEERRTGNDLIDVECNNCGREETVHASLVAVCPKRGVLYRCNNCAGTSGE